MYGSFNHFNVRDGRSFRDVVGSSNGGPHGGPDGAGEKSVVVPDRMVAFKESFGLAVVGRTVNLETLVDFHRLLRIAKIEYYRIQYLGGLSILVSFSDGEAASRFLESREIWNPWFSKLEAWGGQSLPLERVACLKLCGIPLHLIESDVLKLVGELFSKVIHVPESLEEDKDLSFFRIGVLAGEAQRIREFVSLKWKNISFRVWVEEEQEIWVPDCLVGQDGSSSGGGSAEQSSPVGNLGDSGGVGVEGSQKVEGWEGIDESPVEIVGIPHNDTPMHEVVFNVGGGAEVNGGGPSRDDEGIKDGNPFVGSKAGLFDGGSFTNGPCPTRRSKSPRNHRKVNMGCNSNLGRSQVNCGSPPVDQRPKKRSRRFGGSGVDWSTGWSPTGCCF
ncbi:hypothetical protein HanPI659440_Chr14g0562471 [Helianthus annuus]|nr:hypothetical protein HanPI659440_Chr14g0562471 [Helianthus annuus]